MTSRNFHQKDIPIYAAHEIEKSIVDVKGYEYKKIHDSVYKIIEHQRKNKIKDGIKGFIFNGDVGLGKTMIGKILAKSLDYKLILLDCADIARAAYGASEEIIRKAFSRADSEGGAIILFDDVEAIFPKRDWVKGQEWHMSQNNVFFHELDFLDTSKTIVILTTNRYDLVDKAVKDRLVSIFFPYPSEEALIEAARKKCIDLMLDPNKIIKDIKMQFKSINEPKFDDEIDQIAFSAIRNGIDPSGENGYSQLKVFLRKKGILNKDMFDQIYHSAIVIHNSLTSKQIPSFRNLEKTILNYYITELEND
ncbi:MAG: ATP-binding protein [Candidatus Heimdallarchaeaceae archaeon]